MADGSASSSTPRTAGNFSCQRCRRRKQKCSRDRPCINCVQAGTACLTPERLPRRSSISQQYVRSLESRVLELEEQVHDQQQQRQQGSTTHSAESLQRGHERHTYEGHDAFRPLRHSNQLRGSLATPQFRSPEANVQTPATIQASSPIFPNTHNIRGHNSRGQQNPVSGHISIIGPGGIVIDDSPIFSDQTELTMIQTYLERVNPRYPFLHEETFLQWFHSWKEAMRSGDTIPLSEEWKSFFVTMAFAVSLLLAARVSPEERRISNALYSVALSSLSHVFEKPDPVLHVQAYLMCTIHALHSPSSQTVLTMISTTMRCCVISQLHRSMHESSSRDHSTLRETQVRRRVFWSAYSIDRLISWIYHVPCSLSDEHIETRLFANINDNEMQCRGSESNPQVELESLPRQTQVSSALHLIRVRRIQSRILSIMMRADYNKNLSRHYGWRSHILQELEEWRQYLQPHSDPQSKGYTSQGWVGMAFNYTVLLLHRPTKENVRGIVSEKCLQACADIITAFRKYQKDRETAQLWPGLLSQFGIGITLLYCFWATPPSSRSDLYRSPKTVAAIQTCSVILAVFSEQWIEAEPLRDLFDVLSEKILYDTAPTKDDESNRINTYADAASIKSRIPHIQSLVVNTDICRMITEMVTEEFQTPWQDPRSNDLLPAWSSEIHSPGSCFLCENESQEEGSTSPAWVGGFEPSSANLNSHYDDDLFAFPGLFGSVEF